MRTLYRLIVSVLAALPASVALSQTPPSSEQLDRWAADMVQYCSPEIHNYIQVSIKAQRTDFEATYPGVVVSESDWRLSESDFRENTKRSVASLFANVLIKQTRPQLREFLQRDALAIYSNQILPWELDPPYLDSTRQKITAWRDVEICAMARLDQLEYPTSAD